MTPLPAPPQADTITIAVTVFTRTEYVCDAIRSALNQTVPVPVIVVEDCAPTDAVRRLVEETFGDRVRYFRNEERQGIFGNWNRVLDLVQTPWLSILHDDDMLRTTFVEDMIALAAAAPPCGVYFCRADSLEDDGRLVPPHDPEFLSPWRIFDLHAFAGINQVLFPGQLLPVACVRALGGFYHSSTFTGDWDMWYKLAFYYGGAQTKNVDAIARSHSGPGRGTTRVVRSGRKRGLDFVQVRRNFALLRTREPNARYNRRALLRDSPLSIVDLLEVVKGFSPRIVEYHRQLLLLSTPRSIRYALFQVGAAVGGAWFLRFAASFVQRFRGL